MIHHISIAAKDPQHVASILAQLWQTTAMPFPPFPGAFMVIADDGHGTAIEVGPLGLELIPGTTDDEQVQGIINEAASPYTATHAALSIPLSEAEVKRIAAREGWRVETYDRGGIFQVIEFWVENRFLIELLTPAMVSRYLEAMTPRNYAEHFGYTLTESMELVAA